MGKILVTGGAGYIGSHCAVELLEKDRDIVLIDNLSNGSIEAVKRVEELTGKKAEFHECGIEDREKLRGLFKQASDSGNPIESVIHFAGLKAVGESVEKPLMYYENNISGSIVLFKVMREFGCRNIVFSSSATVYGDPEVIPCDETQPVKPMNPYGRTKAMLEDILRDLSGSQEWNVMLLRYFNPVGAHESGRIGEDPEYPNNLVPFVSQVAAGVRDKVVVFGEDWPTKDGTGVRDYIHVTDLVIAHIKALDMISELPGCRVYNLGTGKGYSVLEVIETFSRVSGRKIPYSIGSRREGDIAEIFADSTLAEKELGWRAEYGLEEMISSAWKWQKLNPEGY